MDRHKDFETIKDHGINKDSWDNVRIDAQYAKNHEEISDMFA